MALAAYLALTLLIVIAQSPQSTEAGSTVAFPRIGKSMLYQYFHRPGQDLYLRGYNNNGYAGGARNTNEVRIFKGLSKASKYYSFAYLRSHPTTGAKRNVSLKACWTPTK